MSDSAIDLLLIEDNPGDAGLIRAHLAEQPDFAVHLEQVDRLSAGLKRLENGNVDVVLLDLGLPDSSGLDTFRRAYRHCPTVPIVVLTGAAVMEQALEAVREGAADYLFKGRLDGPLLTRAYAIVRRTTQAEQLTVPRIGDTDDDKTGGDDVAEG